MEAPLLVSVKFHANKHVSAYLLNNFGEKPLINPEHIFHNFLLLCLTHQLTFKNSEVVLRSEQMAIYITKRDYELYGCWMNPRQQQLFNIHVDFYMKTVLVAICDTYLEHHPKARLKNAIDYALKIMKITSEDWDVDSISRYYHRSRLSRCKPLLYNK